MAIGSKKMVKVDCREGEGQQISLYYDMLFNFNHSFNSINNVHVCKKKNRIKSNKTNKKQNLKYM